MDTLQFKTNINCENCVAKVSSTLNENKKIESWFVDVQNADKILTVKGTGISEKEVQMKVAEAGYKASAIGTSATMVQNEHPHNSSPLNNNKNNDGKEKMGFWKANSFWKKAGMNTLNCLIGCTIGDFAMITYLQTYYHEMNMLVMMGLAMAAGIATSILLETFILRIKEGLVWRIAFQTAIGMSLISMVVMELAENITDLTITGGQMAISDPNYWLAMLPSIVVGFLVPLPYNYYQLKKHGKSCH